MNSEEEISLGKLAFEKNQLDEAEKIFQSLLQNNHKNPAIYFYLSLIYQKQGKINQALDFSLKAQIYEPLENTISSYLLKARIHFFAHQYKKTLSFTEKILAIDEKHPEAIFLTGFSYFELGQTQLGEEFFYQLLKNDLNQKQTILVLSIKMLSSYRNKEAKILCNLILKEFPDDIETLFCFSSSLLKRIYSDEDDIYESRNFYQTSLESLHHIVMQASYDTLLKALHLIGNLQPFNLPYQGKNDHYIQSVYGAIITKIINTCHPELQYVPQRKKPTTPKRIRVGFVSHYFYNHSNWKTHLKGWIQQLNKETFSIYCYSTHKNTFKEMDEISLHCCKFTNNLPSFEEYAKCILEDKIDILIYPEIGMDSTTTRLSTLRLAPLQCVSWGHPETSGLSSIDYFLSADLMETPLAQTYYTEKLVKLPNLSIYYEPQEISKNAKRKEFSLPEESILYWCCQNLAKYLPEYDFVFVQIALKVRNAKFVFIKETNVNDQLFLARLEKAFLKENLQMNQYCIFFSRLRAPDFDKLTSLMDIYLDSIGWSGCNTSLESIAHDLCVVTHPLESMRSNHTAAFFKMMGLEEEISTSLEAYIEKAILLGNSKKDRSQLQQKIAKNKQKLYRDKEAIIGLEIFLKNALISSDLG